MVLNWHRNDYFSALMHRDKRSHPALEMLVDDLHADKERTIHKFLIHSGSEDFLWGLVTLLGNDNSRVAGNAAYILGTLAESESGCARVLSLTSHSHPDARRILSDLTNMLRFDDSESVMNAAGTMGTLAESPEGRLWMLNEPCLEDTIQFITDLLTSDNLWTASNAALVLARLTISEEGCEHILNHPRSGHVLAKLISSLGVDEAGRGMNAAFAIGRLCDLEAGRSRLLGLPESERMVSLLAKMLCCTDPGASKNACFALSCLATSKEGHSRLLKNTHSEDVLRTLSQLLTSDDGETGWFAAMTLRTLASQPKGCLRLRDHPSVLLELKARSFMQVASNVTDLYNVSASSDVNEDLHEEVIQTLEILKRLDKPMPCRVTVQGSTTIHVSWEALTTKSGFLVRYQLFEGSRCVYHGKDLEHTLHSLTPHTTYTFRVRASTEGDDSPLSDHISAQTEEDVPSAVENLRILACTTTQLKIGWDPPVHVNGNLKGYYVYNGDKMVDHTHELHCIITSLQPSTAHQISVCAGTSKGKGARSEITGSTVELGAHAPTKPEVTVRGRFELNIAWKPPEVPLGKITRYDVRVNGDVIYSGMDLHHEARRLRPDTEYAITVSAITNEGKCESKVTKKRTAKDDFDGDRAPLYQTPKKEPAAEMDKRDDHSKPVKRPPRKDSYSKARSASAASMKRETMSASPVRVKAATARLVYTHQVHYLNQAKRNEEKQPDSSPDVSRPVSTHAKKDDQFKQSKEESANMPARSHTSVVHPRPSSHRSGSTTSQPHTPANARQPHATTTQPPSTTTSQPHATTTTDIQKHPNSASTTNESIPSTTTTESANTDIASNGNHNPNSGQHEISSKPGRKVLPKPKPPPNVKKSRRTPQQSLSSRSNDNLHTDNRDLSETSRESFDIENRNSKQFSKHRNSKDWSSGANRGVGGSRRPILKKRLSVSNSIDDGLDQEMERPSAAVINTSKSYEYQRAEDQATTFSTFNTSGSFRPADAMNRSKTGLVEFDAPLPAPSSTSGMTPSYVQRANTFIERQRAGPAKRNMASMRSSQPQANNGQVSQQWSPDFPTEASRNGGKMHSKFVPMQFRTQPANLPGGMRRHNTQLGFHDRGQNLERTRTDMVGAQSASSNGAFSYTTAPPNTYTNTYPYNTHTSNHAATVSTGFMGGDHVANHGMNKHYASTTPRDRVPSSSSIRASPSGIRQQPSSSAYHGPARGAPARPSANQQSTQAVMSLAVNQSANATQTKLQGAR